MMFTRQKLLKDVLAVGAVSAIVLFQSISTSNAEDQSVENSFDEGITFTQGINLPERLQTPAPVLETPCEGNNYENDDFLDNVLMGGPMVSISWVPTSSMTVTRIEFFTGETAGPIALAIWSDDGGSPSKPLVNLGNTGYVMINTANSWQGANLLNPVTVTAGTKYWFIFDPNGGEQSPVTNNPGDIQQTYWGSNSGDVTSGAAWFGPFSFSDRRWKFRLFCSPSHGSLDHFKCYSAKGDNEPPTVGLIDQFGKEGNVFGVKPWLKARLLCNPVAKRHDDRLSLINHPEEHLTCYWIKPNITNKTVVVANQFGEQKLQVVKSKLLCVPSKKYHLEDVQPDEPDCREPSKCLPPPDCRLEPSKCPLDHFKCYSVKGDKNKKIKVVLKDQFMKEEVKVLRPRMLCNPATKWHDGQEFPIRNPEKHLVCYGIKPSTEMASKTVIVANQFGKHKLQVDESKLLCVPSKKYIVDENNSGEVQDDDDDDD